MWQEFRAPAALFMCLDTCADDAGGFPSCSHLRWGVLLLSEGRIFAPVNNLLDSSLCLSCERDGNRKTPPNETESTAMKVELGEEASGWLCREGGGTSLQALLVFLGFWPNRKGKRPGCSHPNTLKMLSRQPFHKNTCKKTYFWKVFKVIYWQNGCYSLKCSEMFFSDLISFVWSKLYTLGTGYYDFITWIQPENHAPLNMNHKINL